MNTIEQMFAEYEQLKSERDYAVKKVEEYASIYRALAAALNMDPAQLLDMKVVSVENEVQAWNYGKEVMYITLEKNRKE